MTRADTAQPMLPLWRQLTWWVLAFPLVMIIAMAFQSVYLLNWVHVLSGVLWTGADLFMGFIVGPVLRALDLRTRTTVITFLVPRTLLYFPIVALTAGTAGWTLATWLGFMNPDNSMHSWALVSLGLVLIMTVIGLAVLLPNNLRIWMELRRPSPNTERISRINRVNIWLSGTQGVMQVLMILIMAHFVF